MTAIMVTEDGTRLKGTLRVSRLHSFDGHLGDGEILALDVLVSEPVQDSPPYHRIGGTLYLPVKALSAGILSP